MKEELIERERKWKWMKKEVQDSCLLVQMAFRKLLLVSFKATLFGLKMWKLYGLFGCAFENLKSAFNTLKFRLKKKKLFSKKNSKHF